MAVVAALVGTGLAAPARRDLAVLRAVADGDLAARPEVVGRDEGARTAEAVSGAVDLAATASGSVERLGRSSDEIGEVVRVIASIAADITARVAALRTDSEGATGALADISAVITRIGSSQAAVGAAVEQQEAAARRISEDVGVAVGGVAQLVAGLDGAQRATVEADADLARSLAATDPLVDLVDRQRSLSARFTLWDLPVARPRAAAQGGGVHIAVTGGSGKLGRAVVADLIAHGHTVLNLDRDPPPGGPPEGSRWLRTDLTDHGQVLEALTGVDEHRGPDGTTGIEALVHLGAVPAPGLAPDSATFQNNVVSTWSAFAAARAARVTNVVWASSETVLGLPFDEAPPYAPVDEDYAPRPNSSYSLSKDLGEEMARQFCRWDPGAKILGLRFSNVMEPADYAAFPSYDADPQARRWNLWGYVDARDGAQAVRLALEHDATGADVFVVANADTVMSRSSADLMAEVYPGVPVRDGLGEHETLLCIDKARRVLGYEPAHSWRVGPSV